MYTHTSPRFRWKAVVSVAAAVAVGVAAAAAARLRHFPLRLTPPCNSFHRQEIELSSYELLARRQQTTPCHRRRLFLLSLLLILLPPYPSSFSSSFCFSTSPSSIFSSFSSYSSSSSTFSFYSSKFHTFPCHRHLLLSFIPISCQPKVVRGIICDSMIKYAVKDVVGDVPYHTSTGSILYSRLTGTQPLKSSCSESQLIVITTRFLG